MGPGSRPFPASWYFPQQPTLVCGAGPSFCACQISVPRLSDLLSWKLVATSGLAPSCLGTEGLHIPGHPDLALGSTAPASIPGRPQAGLKFEFRNAESEAVRCLFPGQADAKGPVVHA